MPLTAVELRRVGFSRRTWNATTVHNPAVVLLSCGTSLSVLLAKNVQHENGRTLLRGVNWVRIPLGWRLTLLRLLSHFRAAMLPEEWMFNEVTLRPLPRSGYVADLMPEKHCALPLEPASRQPFSMKPLTHGQYALLVGARGRLFHAQVAAVFGLPLPASPLRWLERLRLRPSRA